MLSSRGSAGPDNGDAALLNVLDLLANPLELGGAAHQLRVRPQLFLQGSREIPRPKQLLRALHREEDGLRVERLLDEVEGSEARRLDRLEELAKRAPGGSAESWL